MKPRRLDIGLALILLVALLARVDLANIRGYIHDEANTAIPLAETISFSPGSLNLPLRGENHGALPAYVVKTSSLLFGTSRLGFRMMHVLMGLGAILLVALVARQWYGPVAARWTAALLAFNEYFFYVSSRATAHVPYLFFVALAIFALSRFLASERAFYLYVATASLGVAFYSKEHAALLVPLLGLTLLRPHYRRWLRSPHAWLAVVVFVLVLAPDVLWNLRTDRQTARVTYGEQEAAYATYESHLRRIGGVGLSPYPLMFYTRSAVQAVSVGVTGAPLQDNTTEYPSMNPLLGAVLLGGVVLMTMRLSGAETLRVSLLLLFWGVFAFFTFIERGNPPGRLDPVSWIWVESTMMSAVILTGGYLSRLEGWPRRVIWAVTAVALVYGGWMVYR